MFGLKTATFPREIRAHFTLTTGHFLLRKKCFQKTSTKSAFFASARTAKVQVRSSPRKILEKFASPGVAHFTHRTNHITHGQIRELFASAR
jgi:hypothetical protein